MEYQGIIFDFNGTLFFDNDKHVKAWNEISKILRGKEITLEELHTKLNGTPNIQNILYFTDGKATKEELEKYSQKKEEYYRQFCKEDTEKFHLVDGVCEFFDHLKEKDIPFTIASASIKENIDFFIDGQQPHRPVTRTRTAADIQRRCRDCAGLPCREGKLRAHQKNTADYRE